MNTSQRKLERAKLILNQLSIHISKEVRDPKNKAQLKARYNDTSLAYEIYISDIPDLEHFTKEVSISVGIIIHLLRSSLDNLVYSLAQKATSGNIKKPKKIAFPISDKKEKYDSISELLEEDKIKIESYQPFHGISGRPDTYSGPYVHQLSLLQTISNSDKHRDIVAVSFDPNEFQFSHEASPIIHAWQAWTPIECFEGFRALGPTLMQVGQMVMLPIKLNQFIGYELHAGTAVAQITLDERRPIVDTLSRISDFVEMILASFELT